MSSAVTEHLDEFTLLRFVARDMDDLERGRAGRHVRSCAACAEGLESTRRLDETLREHAREILLPTASGALPAGDAFAKRPRGARRPLPEGVSVAALAALCAGARRSAEPVARALLASLERPPLATTDALRSVDVSSLEGRLGIGYALDESVSRFGDGPARWKRFGREVIALVEPQLEEPAPRTAEEFAYPLADLLGRAHTVVGWVLNWSGELDRAGEELALAYASFGRGSATAQDLATVELHESQRRSFLERAAEALVLARRCRDTFEKLTLEAFAAKARFAEGLALSYLERDREAVPLFRSALEPLATEGLWNAYVSVLNNLGTSHMELGEHAEAKRAYAQALRRVSRERHPNVHAFIRFNLGLLHLRQGELRDAVRAFGDAAPLFESHGSPADALNAKLHLIEAFARAGEMPRAFKALEELEKAAAADPRLDPSSLREIARALAGGKPDLGRLRELRDSAVAALRIVGA